MKHTDKVKHIRGVTFSPINKVNEALKRSNGDVDVAIKILIDEKQADANEMANRTANTKIVYSYVHNNRVGAMIVLACQTDFVAKNESFLKLAKDICMHIVSTPIAPEYIQLDQNSVEAKKLIHYWYESEWKKGLKNKPEHVIQKILDGKINKRFDEICLLNQPFVRDDNVTIAQLIGDVSSTLGEKIELIKFIKMVAQ